MKKKSFKTIASAAVMTGILTSSIAPSYAFAAENPAQDQAVYKERLTKSLGTEDLNALLNLINNVKSNTLTLDVYALTLQKQPIVTFSQLPSSTTRVKDAVQGVKTNQEAAIQNASKWLNDIKPQLVSVNEGILNYSQKFQIYTNRLNTAIKQKDTPTFLHGLTNLNSDIIEQKGQVDKVINDLTKFRDDIAINTRALKAHSETINSEITGDNALIPQLKAELKEYNRTVSTLTSGIALGTVGIVTGAVLLATGGVMLFTGVGAPIALPVLGAGGIIFAGGVGGTVASGIALDKLRNKIKDGASQLSHLEQEKLGLEAINGQVNIFTNEIDKAILALQGLSNSWGTMSAKYNSLISNIKAAGNDGITGFSTEDMTQISNKWKEIEKASAAIQIDVKYGK
ncbi:HBL/NHE enterotoxin family protein [Bacillus cereus]|uniref:HBL/NHE enterotoxin family protein n=1 Tax=Bacillus cereus TaxID=1396 RepID=UPI003D65766F